MAKRTQGIVEVGYGDVSNALGIFTKKMLDDKLEQAPICLISPIDKMTEVDKANAAFIATAWNNHERLLVALKGLLQIYQDKTYGDNVWRLKIEELAEAAIKMAEGDKPAASNIHPIFQQIFKSFGIE